MNKYLWHIFWIFLFYLTSFLTLHNVTIFIRSQTNVKRVGIYDVNDVHENNDVDTRTGIRKKNKNRTTNFAEELMQ